MTKWKRYIGKLIRKKILKGRTQAREFILDKEKLSRNDDRVTCNIMYYPVFKNIRNILEQLHILFARDEQHRKVFKDIFFLSGFSSQTLTIYRTTGEGRKPSFIPFHHFHPLTNIETFICNFACDMATRTFNRNACIYQAATR